MNINKRYQQSSDIFHTKDINKPEYNEAPKRTRYNNKSTNDILSWNKEPSKVENKRKPINMENVAPKMSQEPEHKIPYARATTGKRTSSSIYFGNSDNSDYKLKKDKTKTYNPMKYLKDKSDENSKEYNDPEQVNLYMKYFTSSCVSRLLFNSYFIFSCFTFLLK